MPQTAAHRLCNRQGVKLTAECLLDIQYKGSVCGELLLHRADKGKFTAAEVTDIFLQQSDTIAGRPFLQNAETAAVFTVCNGRRLIGGESMQNDLIRTDALCSTKKFSIEIDTVTKPALIAGKQQK